MAEQDVAAQVRAMRSVRDFERLKAAGAFEEADGYLLDAILEVFANETRKKPWRFWAALLTSMVAWGVVLAVLDSITHRALGGAIGGLGAVAFGIAKVAAESPLHRRLRALVADLGDPRTLGPLVDALDRQETPSRGPVAKALTKLLPQLTANNRALLSRSQRARLGSALEEDNADLAAAAMAALVRIGDCSCYERVERLAQGKGLARKHADLWQAAKAALPTLVALREQERHAATLLRPADAPADATLLRPAEGAPHGDDAALLRPAEAPAQEVEAHG